MMKKIISLTFGLLMAMVAWGQGSAAVDTLTPAQDSVSIGSHTEFAAAKISDDNVTKQRVIVHICEMIMLLPFKFMRVY